MVNLNIPVGVSDFEKIRENNYYYIDKTGFIARLLQMKSAEVTLITRPRRFGKTLGMRMLASFFDIRKDSRSIFEGLEITRDTALCKEWMNQYPTLFLSFKDVDVLFLLADRISAVQLQTCIIPVLQVSAELLPLSGHIHSLRQSSSLYPEKLSGFLSASLSGLSVIRLIFPD